MGTIDPSKLTCVGQLGPRPPPGELLYIIRELCPEGPDDVGREIAVEDATQQLSLEHQSSMAIAPTATLEWFARCLKRCRITRDLIPAPQLRDLAEAYQRQGADDEVDSLLARDGVGDLRVSPTPPAVPPSPTGTPPPRR